MKNPDDNKNTMLKCLIEYIGIVAVIILVAMFFRLFNLRLDLTEDKRYTLSEPTKKILSEIKNDIFIQVFLDGDIPIPLKRLKRSVQESLEEFRIASHRKIDYEFINPSEAEDAEQREMQYQYLVNKGLSPNTIQATDAEGGSSMKLIFPGMILNSNGVEIAVNFLSNNQTISYEQNILHSQEGLEYNLIQAINTIASDTVYTVAFIEGHGELDEIHTADITMSLVNFFTVDRGVIGGKLGVLNGYSAVIIAGPEDEYNEVDKLVIDQYIMQGGKVLWLCETVAVSADSLIVNGSTVGLYRPVNLEDMLFRYGVRINSLIVQDIECQLIRLMVMSGGTRQQVVPVPWVYYPLLIPSNDHPITRNLNRIKGEFVNYIDTVGLDGAIHKKTLLHTSQFAKTVSPPVVIRLSEAETIPDEREFNKSNLPVAVLLEGRFQSAFSNRPAAMISGNNDFNFLQKSADTRMIVVADADIIKNKARRSGYQEMPLPLGVDEYTGEVFGNKDFILNCINWMVDDKGIMELRSRELKLRLLNSAKVRNEKVKWQVINTVCPLILLLLSGLLYGYLRKRKYRN
jgi:gliding-associated putative ABC transporter substrate-binding component GldG